MAEELLLDQLLVLAVPIGIKSLLEALYLSTALPPDIDEFSLVLMDLLLLPLYVTDLIIQLFLKLQPRLLQCTVLLSGSSQ